MNDRSNGPPRSSDPIRDEPVSALLRAGRKIDAPPHLWSRIESRARAASAIRPSAGHPRLARVAAVAAGALLYLGAIRLIDRTGSASAEPMPDEYLRHVAAAASPLAGDELRSDDVA